MKYLSPEAKKRHKRILRLRWKKRTKRSGSEICLREPVLLSAPIHLSISSKKYSSDTLKFISKIRGALDKGILMKTPVKIDLSSIKEISIPSAIAIAAEFLISSRKSRFNHRNRKFIPHNVKKWHPRVYALMHHIGLFKILDLKNPKRKTSLPDHPVIYPFRVGSRTDPENLSKLVDKVGSIMKGNATHALYGAVIEAVANVTEHAYPPEAHTPTSEAIWLSTACYDKIKGQVMIFVYDRGVGMPTTLRKRNWMQTTLARLGISTDAKDIDLLKAAFEPGRSRHNSPERGRGLGQMRQAIEETENAQLRIISGHAVATVLPDGNFKECNLSEPVKGTMVIWRIPLNGNSDTDKTRAAS